MNDEQAAAAQEMIARALAEAASVDFVRLDPPEQDYWRALARAAVAAMAAVSRDMENERRHRRHHIYDYGQQFPLPRIDYNYPQQLSTWETTTVTNSTNTVRLGVGATVDFASFTLPAQPDNPDPDEE